MRFAFYGCILLSCGLVQSSLADDNLRAYASRLDAAGIAPNQEEISAFLQGLEPSDSQREQNRQWIGQLSSPSYAEREKATRLLITSPTINDDLLQAVIDGNDDEASWRATTIVAARSTGMLERNTLLVLQYIGAGGTPAMTDSIMTSVRMFERVAVLNAASEALAATLDPLTSDELKPYLQSDLVRVRLVALRAWLAIEPEEFEYLWSELKDDSEPAIQYYLSEQLARQSDRRSLRMLLHLMEADSTSDYRERAARALRSITGNRFAFSTFGTQEEQAAALVRWNDWLDENEESFEMLPLRSRIMHGRVLLTLYSQGKALELDEDDNVVWEVELSSAFACQGLENGNRLIAQYSAGRVVEYDSEGNLVWEVTDLPSNLSGISRSADGNTIVAAGQGGNLVFELDPAGKKVWEVVVNGTPVHAVRLENGRTLLSMMSDNRVVEVDREGEILWELKVEGQPYHAQRLDDGNTLVRFSKGGAAEYTRDGAKVWEAECGAGYSVQRLEDGNTILPSQEGFKIVSPSGEVIRENKNYTGYIYTHKY